MRLRATLLALAVTGAATLTAAAPAHAAAVYPSVVVTCDDVANQVTARTAGGPGFLRPNLVLTVEFHYVGGSYARAGLIRHPAQRAPVRVKGKTTADGTLVASGYTRSWPDAASYEFYTERVRAVVTDRVTGAPVVTIDGTCSVDRRTTVTLECDPATNMVTARASGVRYGGYVYYPDLPPISQVRVSYDVVRTTQRSRDDVRWTQYSSAPIATHAVPLADGRWSDVGYTVTLPDGFYYYRDDLKVTVTAGPVATVVGRGSASCEYRDAPA